MTSPTSTVLKKTPKKAVVKPRSAKRVPLTPTSTPTATENKVITRSTSKHSLNDTKSLEEQEDIENRPPRSHTTPNKRHQTPGKAAKADVQASSGGPEEQDGLQRHATADADHSVSIADMSGPEVARRRGGRGRSRKTISARQAGAGDTSALDSGLPSTNAGLGRSESWPHNTALEGNDESNFVSEDEGVNASNNGVPKMSSPLAPSKHADASSKTAKSTGNTSINKSGSKPQRGVVAEMYAHERRQARATSTGAAPSPAVAAAAVAPVPAPVLPVAANRVLAAGQAPAATYYPYGIPTVPATADASLSPYGLSPFADPNASWTTNVYVNNLPPHTTDDDLLRLGSCFGRVKSHKAIINQESGLCKGYGFIMYEFLHDAELAIQQLPLHGLSTSWAKESFSSKLRRMADSTTSNVYLSNLPQDITPAQLEQLFQPHFVVSLRILTDSSSGKSRGVGFVRLRDRRASQECIERLNGMVFPGQESPLQARFADSEAQKQFKLCARVQLSKDPEPKNAGDLLAETDAGSTAAPTAVTAAAAPPANATAAAPVFVTALQGQHSWTGFATPASTAGGFSPMLGLMSPQMSGAPPGMAAYPGVSPQMAALPIFGPHEAAMQHFDAATAAYLGRRMPGEVYDPFTGTHRMDWLAAQRAAAALPIPMPSGLYGMVQNQPQQQPGIPQQASSSHATPGHGHRHPEVQHNGSFTVPSRSVSASSSLMQQQQSKKTRTTYLPPDLALQHTRALMEKGAQGAQQAHAFGLTQQHVDNERADLLKLLKEANDNLTRLRVSQLATSEGNNATATPPTSGVTNSSSSSSVLSGNGGALGLLGMTSSASTAVEPTLTSVTRVTRRFSNPNSAVFGMTANKSGKDASSATASQLRPSVTTASLSPLRFMYSKDPKAPISVEAVDLTSAPAECGAEEVVEGESGTDCGTVKQEVEAVATSSDRVDTPIPTNRPAATEKSEAQKADGSATTSTAHFDQPSTVMEEDKENTTVDESDAHESSYTSAGGTTTSSNNDESNTSSEIMLRKSDAGQAFDVAQVKLTGSHSASSGLTGIMIMHGADGNTGEKRSRSKSVVIHAPFDVAGQHYASVDEHNLDTSVA